MNIQKTTLPRDLFDIAMAEGIITEKYFTCYQPPSETEKLLLRLNTGLMSGEIRVENP